jgi:hypothetical protein
MSSTKIILTRYLVTVLVSDIRGAWGLSFDLGSYQFQDTPLTTTVCTLALPILEQGCFMARNSHH